MWTPHTKKWGVNLPPGPCGSAAPVSNVEIVSRAARVEANNLAGRWLAQHTAQLAMYRGAAGALEIP